jgi:hypothetical protein
MNLFKTRDLKGKTIPISPAQVHDAWRRVKASNGSGGIDGKTLAMVEVNLNGELYKLWNRMASGSYHPMPVKAVSIPKMDGSERWLGIPTVCDRVAQQVVKNVLECELERVFHKDSYGYRPSHKLQGQEAHYPNFLEVKSASGNEQGTCSATSFKTKRLDQLLWKVSKVGNVSGIQKSK